MDQGSLGASASGEAADVSRSIDVAAPAAEVWALVSDLPAMGAFSPENTGGRWVSGDGPAVGAVFVGSNGSGRRRWSTRCTVVRSEPGRAFSFDVSSVGLPVARWSYALEPTGDGCRLTEQWHDRRGRLVTAVGRLVTGVADRRAFTAVSIEATLQAVKDRAEQARAV